MFISRENNTIYGTKYKKLPNTKGKTLVADLSSCFLSNLSMSLITASSTAVSRKTSAPAGMVISIIRDDLITDDVLPGTPTMMKFKTHADAGSCTIHRTATASIMRQGIQMAEENGRPGSYETAQRRKKQNFCTISWIRASSSKEPLYRKTVL